MGVNFPNILVINADLKIKTFAEFVAHAKAHPGKLEYASTGAGSASHLAGELMDDMAKIDTMHVPYHGGAPALQDLLGGRVAMYYSTLNTAQPHIQSGKLIPRPPGHGGTPKCRTCPPLPNRATRATARPTGTRL
jgi:tripartite-type tricarboxylate transporter receptor subunit TctC